MGEYLHPIVLNKALVELIFSHCADSIVLSKKLTHFSIGYQHYGLISFSKAITHIHTRISYLHQQQTICSKNLVCIELSSVASRRFLKPSILMGKKIIRANIGFPYTCVQLPKSLKYLTLGLGIAYIKTIFPSKNLLYMHLNIPNTHTQFFHATNTNTTDANAIIEYSPKELQIVCASFPHLMDNLPNGIDVFTHKIYSSIPIANLPNSLKNGSLVTNDYYFF